jgi:catechol 2,3-dioxygenase-like lactoylglutathione lyase family enzyme
MKFGAVQHIAISVSNMEEALKFYCGLLGFETMTDMELKGDPAIETAFGVKNIMMRYVLLNNEGATLNLLEFTSPRGKNIAEKFRPYDHGIHHLAFVVDDVEATYKELSTKGACFISPPQNFGMAKGNFIQGPDGVMIELVQFLTE